HLDLDHNLKFIFNGVDEARLHRPSRDIRKEMGLAESAVLLGMVANFYPAPRKDQLTVCRALPRVFREIPNAHFLFVHSGGINEDKDKIKACIDVCEAAGISSRVHFLENRFPAMDVLQNLDIFVLSSLHEGLPISVKEAMLLRKPCILSDIGPLIEISDRGKHAVIFKTADADDLAEKLIALVRDPQKRKALGESGRKWALENFSIDAHLTSLKKLYEELAAR
ncbi:MAG: glycosyltransferase family 4 protein, partial [Acidobacteriota bacterium]